MKGKFTIEKEEKFREVFSKFYQSEKSSQDFVELFAVVRNVTAMGSGLMYDRLEQIMQEEMDK